MKEIFKHTIQWLLSVFIGFVLVNIICFAYDRPVGWIDTPNGASEAVRRPNGILVHGTEGYGINKVDYNGYTKRAKKDKFFAQVWNPLHDESETREYPKEVSELDI